jgi:hypothetical protein
MAAATAALGVALVLVIQTGAAVAALVDMRVMGAQAL